MGGVWATLGRLLDTFGRMLAVFGRSKSYLFETLVQHELQEAFGVDLESLSNDFGMVWGRFWGGFGKSLGSSWQDLKGCMRISTGHLGLLLTASWRLLD